MKDNNYMEWIAHCGIVKVGHEAESLNKYNKMQNNEI